jgi:uncharacterized membrane protein YgaE (UPF0421/DUF939 family)
MSVGGRADTRARMLRRAGLIAAGLAILALLLLVTSHWIIGILVAIPAAVAIWVFLQARAVR